MPARKHRIEFEPAAIYVALRKAGKEIPPLQDFFDGKATIHAGAAPGSGIRSPYFGPLRVHVFQIVVEWPDERGEDEQAG